MFIGYSTGSLAKGDFRKAISLLNGKSTNAIELSALRESELKVILDSLDDLDLNQFEYISFHAPSKFNLFTEKEITKLLEKVLEHKWPIIIHPDVIENHKIWKHFGKYLCIENMDKRKTIGRTVSELKEIFNLLPEASFCLDIAHARQIDPTMTEAALMLNEFPSRLKQLHVSAVNSNSIHESLNLEALFAYKQISNLIPSDIPLILEAPVSSDKIEPEIIMASYFFDDLRFENYLSSKDTLLNNYFALIKKNRKLFTG